ncbi:heavy-metal-associated domain-containing protein [Aquimarina rhabdastrellae]
MLGKNNIHSNSFYDMETTLYIHNLKCNGCVNSITQKLLQCTDITSLKIDLAHTAIHLKHQESIDLSLVKSKLKDMGYPVIDEKNALSSKAKSYISCAIGKIKAI